MFVLYYFLRNLTPMNKPSYEISKIYFLLNAPKATKGRFYSIQTNMSCKTAEKHLDIKNG